MQPEMLVSPLRTSSTTAGSDSARAQRQAEHSGSRPGVGRRPNGTLRTCHSEDRRCRRRSARLISVDEPVNGLIPDRAHVQAIEFFADQCAVAVTHARRYEEVRAEALTDSLTGLANRRALDAAVVSRNRPCASRRRTVHRAFHRHRPFQGHQRFSWPRRGATPCCRPSGGGSGSSSTRRSAWRATEARSSSHCCPTRTSRPRCGLPRSSGAVSPRSTSTADRRAACACLNRRGAALRGAHGRGVHWSPPPTRRCTRPSARGGIGLSSAPEPVAGGCATTGG